MKHSFIILCCIFISSLIKGAELEIIHINIGQGDSTLILGPLSNDGKRVSVLMDAGDITMGGYKKDGGKVVGAVLRKHGLNKVDYFISSHYDADHIGGVITGRISTHGSSFVLGANNEPGAIGDDDNDSNDGWATKKKIIPDDEELGLDDDISIGTFVDRGDNKPPSSQTYKKYKAMASSSKWNRISIDSKSKVNSFEIDLGDEAKMIVLAANGWVRNRSTKVANVNTENERSICFLITFRGFQYLLGGDTIGRKYGSENAEVEKAIGEYLSNESINIDVLHVNHHGGNNGSAEEFLALIQPETAIISAGNGNPHHHPNKDVLERLIDAGVYRIYQTEWGTTRGEIPEKVRRHQAILQGDIIIKTDGSLYSVSTSRTFDVDD